MYNIYNCLFTYPHVKSSELIDGQTIAPGEFSIKLFALICMHVELTLLRILATHIYVYILMLMLHHEKVTKRLL